MSELLEKILDKRNMNEAYRKVCANKGAGGVDGMEIKELDGYIRENWDSIKEQIRKRSYKPQPVRRVDSVQTGAVKWLSKTCSCSSRRDMSGLWT